MRTIRSYCREWGERQPGRNASHQSAPYCTSRRWTPWWASWAGSRHARFGTGPPMSQTYCVMISTDPDVDTRKCAVGNPYEQANDWHLRRRL